MGRKKALQQSPKKATVKKSTVSQRRTGTPRLATPAREYRPQQIPRPSERSLVPSFPVVGIGASAGGLEAFTHLLEHLPLDTGMAFVLVQHLDPTHQSMLTDLLSKATQLPVSQVTNGIAIEPNHVYIFPPNSDMFLADLTIMLRPRSIVRGH